MKQISFHFPVCLTVIFYCPMNGLLMIPCCCSGHLVTNSCCLTNSILWKFSMCSTWDKTNTETAKLTIFTIPIAFNISLFNWRMISKLMLLCARSSIEIWCSSTNCQICDTCSNIYLTPLPSFTLPLKQAYTGKESNLQYWPGEILGLFAVLISSQKNFVIYKAMLKVPNCCFSWSFCDRAVYLQIATILFNKLAIKTL